MTSEEIIDKYKLKPHPEGGYFRRIYESKKEIMFGGMNRPVCTAIYFLLKEGQYSRLHRIPQDEIWHFYLGGPLRLVIISPLGEIKKIILGHCIEQGQLLQYTVPAGVWFGAKPMIGSDYSLVGCTVSPGFCMEELELGLFEDLIFTFPSAKSLIEEFCPQR